jgi:hypothetical protein
LASKVLKFSGIFCAVLLLLGLLYTYQDVFIKKDNLLKNIYISGQNFISDTEILNLTNLKIGQPMGSLKPETVRDLLEMHPRIENVDAKLEYPDTISIKILERKAVLIINTQKKLYEIDAALNILSENDIRDLSLIILTVPFEVTGRKYTGKYRTYLYELIANLGNLKKNYPTIFSWLSEFILENNNRLRANLVGRKMIIDFGLGVDDMKIRKLHASLSYIQRKNLYPKFLDLSGVDGIF